MLLLLLFTGLSALADPLPSSLIQLGKGTKYSRFAFVVDKEKRELSVWENPSDGSLPQRLKSFVADIGKSAGDKQHVGDHKTPVGVYFLLEMLQGKKIPFELYGSRAYTTNYPNYFDKRDGKTGSGIWLHAVPDTTPLTRGSRGCVVIRDEAILDVEQYFSNTTPILIEEKTQLVSAEELLKTRMRVKSFLSKWLSDWQGQDISAYMSSYHKNFRGKKMNKKQWGRYKTRVKSLQTFSEIAITEPVILSSGDELTVRFLQDFRSNSVKDFGEKTLYLYDTDEGLKIFGEFWKKDDTELGQRELAENPFSLTGHKQGNLTQ